MLVGERMKSPVITVPPDLAINEALKIMKEKNIRRTPVVKEGKLVGIISDKDLLNASPSPATSLSVWELNYLLSKITVNDVMTRDVMTVNEDTPIEVAACVMADHKIGGLPVMRGDNVVGIITETDLFKIFLEMMGAREPGVRVTLSIADKPGQLAKITKAIADLGGNFISFGTFGQLTGSIPATYLITFKVAGLTPIQVRAAVEPIADKVLDLRTN